VLSTCAAPYHCRTFVCIRSRIARATITCFVKQYFPVSAIAYAQSLTCVRSNRLFGQALCSIDQIAYPVVLHASEWLPGLVFGTEWRKYIQQHPLNRFGPLVVIPHRLFDHTVPDHCLPGASKIDVAAI
jgi:hypothetical protein